MPPTTLTKRIAGDIRIAKRLLRAMPCNWGGKKCVLEMKAADYQWRQMEWWAFYFEMQCRALLASQFEVPGDKFGRVCFDSRRSINCDFKAKAIKSDSHWAILNDQVATRKAVEKGGAYGAIIALCDVEYNDDDRSFQKWHTELKGGHSRYEKDRIARTSVSRYRKTSAVLKEILFVVMRETDLTGLATMRQGRNSNAKPRAPKFSLDLENLDGLLADRLRF